MSEVPLKLYEGSLVYSQALTNYSLQTWLTELIGSWPYIGPFGPSALGSQESNAPVVDSYSRQAAFQGAQPKYGVPPYGGQCGTGPYGLVWSQVEGISG